MQIQDKIHGAVARIESAFREIARIGSGSGFTLHPTATRANVVAMTQMHGLCHLRELADGLVTQSEQEPDLFAQLVASQNVVELNSGGGLSGLLVAMLAATDAKAPRVFFIDHAKAAVDFAVELAARLDVQASGFSVIKHYLNAPPNELPDNNGTLTSATLEPALPQLAGPTTIVAGHALSVNTFAPGNRQANLALQNRLILGQVDQALDPAARVVLLQLDIAHCMASTMPDFQAMICAKENSSRNRNISSVFEASPANRTPGKEGRGKYFAALQLDALPCADELVVWSVGDCEILLSKSEVDALIGQRASHCRYESLQELVGQGVR